MQPRRNYSSPWLWSGTLLLATGICGLSEALRASPGTQVYIGRTASWMDASQAIYVYGFFVMAGFTMLAFAIARLFRSIK